MKQKKKGRILLLIAFLIGLAYAIYSFSYWGGAIGTAGSSSEQLGAGIATALVTPHVVLASLAVVFNALALLLYNRGFALVAAILYTVALAVFPMYFMFVVLEMILCYVAFARMKKKSE